MSLHKIMNENHSLRVGLTILTKLLAIIDDLAERHFTSRSDILRMALVEFMKKPENAPPTSKALLEVLAGPALQVLKRYKKGEIAFKQLIEEGISWEMQLELMKMGEL